MEHEKQLLFEQVAQDNGESSVTFKAIVVYANKYRPPFIILENIQYAPWIVIRRIFEVHGYRARHVLVDTKNYYLPQTRLRGYMLCVDSMCVDGSEAERILRSWARRMRDFERPASSCVEDFLLPEANPLLQAALAEGAQRTGFMDPIKADMDWTLCQNLHHRVRAKHRLGEGSPYTNRIQGRSTMPLYASRSWAESQPDRVKEMLDMLKLHEAIKLSDFELNA